MKKWIKRSFIIGLFFLLFFVTLRVSAQEEKKVLDLKDARWNESTFIYDNTLKTVELINIPEEIDVKYLQNSYTIIGSYQAQADLIYDEDLYEIINLDESILTHYWEIVRGRYDISTMRFLNKSVLEDGLPQSILVDNLPEGLNVSYSNNEQVAPGRYEITATFTGNPYYEVVHPKKAILTIRSRRVSSSDEVATFISEEYGFDPDLVLKHSWLDIEPYQDLDLTSIGAYRELKGAFKFDLELNGEASMLDFSVKVRLELPDDLAQSKDLLIYDYSNQRLVNMASSRDKDTMSFNVTSLSDCYLIIGVRNTYSATGAWKAFIIVLITILFIAGLFLARFIYKRRKGRLV